LGATVTVQIPDGHTPAQGGLQVPIGALIDNGHGAGVWVVSGEPAKVAWRPVAVRHVDDDSARVDGQLKPGERIVALGAQLLREGEQVRVASVAVTLAAEGGRP
jgi:multidrug efflux pump subunit AcrA (membrane-fusion protein)